jgi:hypothetical protein
MAFERNEGTSVDATKYKRGNPIPRRVATTGSAVPHHKPHSYLSLVLFSADSLISTERQLTGHPYNQL